MRFAFVTALLLTFLSSFGADPSTNSPIAGMNPEQRAKMREASEKFRTEQAALYRKLQAARRDLEKAAQAETTDEKTIRERAAVLGQVEGDLALLRARHYRELRALLPGSSLTNTVPATADPVAR